MGDRDGFACYPRTMLEPARRCLVVLVSTSWLVASGCGRSGPAADDAGAGTVVDEVAAPEIAQALVPDATATPADVAAVASDTAMVVPDGAQEATADGAEDTTPDSAAAADVAADVAVGSDSGADAVAAEPLSLVALVRAQLELETDGTRRATRIFESDDIVYVQEIVTGTRTAGNATRPVGYPSLSVFRRTAGGLEPRGRYDDRTVWTNQLGSVSGSYRAPRAKSPLVAPEVISARPSKANLAAATRIFRLKFPQMAAAFSAQLADGAVMHDGLLGDRAAGAYMEAFASSIVGETDLGLDQLVGFGPYVVLTDLDIAPAYGSFALVLRYEGGKIAEAWTYTGLGARVESLNASSDKTRLAFAIYDGGAMRLPPVRDVDTSDVWVAALDGPGLWRVTTSHRGASPQWAPGTMSLVVQDADNVEVVTDTGKFMRHLCVGGVTGSAEYDYSQCTPPLWSPDGRFAAIGKSSGGLGMPVIVVHVATGETVATFQDIHEMGHVKWSDKGFTARIEGGQRKTLTPAQLDELAAAAVAKHPGAAAPTTPVLPRIPRPLKTFTPKMPIPPRPPTPRPPTPRPPRAPKAP